MSRRLSFSRMAHAHLCLYGFRDDVPMVPRPPGFAARAGTLVHWMAERHLQGEAVPVQSGATKAEWETAFAIFNGPLKGYLDARNWTGVELGLRYDAATDTCAAGPRRGDAGYDDHARTVLKGTLDLVRVEEGRAIVRDLKTGKPPADSEQLYAQAVAVSRLYRVDSVEVGYTRALKTKLEELRVETLDADRLDAEAGRIGRILRRLPTSQPTPNDACCWKCEARPACPAFAEVRAERTETELAEAGFFE